MVTSNMTNSLTRSVALAISATAIGLLGLSGCSEPVKLGPDDGTGYMISYEGVQELGYEVAWQSSAARSLIGEATRIVPGDEYIIVGETGANVISAVTERDGTPVWEETVGDRLERLLGVSRVGNEIFVSTQSDLYILDLATGRTKSAQRYGDENIASTMPLIFMNSAIYGTSDGRIVYHNFRVGRMRGAYRVGAGIDMSPMLAGTSAALVVTRTGRINLVDPISNIRFWETGVLDPVQATPVLGDSGLFVAGRDQSIWAFRLADGRQMWRTRFQQPLTDDPKLIENTLYQAVPNAGFAALNATSGQILWQNPEVAGGTVLTRHRNDLIVWDRDDGPDSYGSTFYRVDATTGDVLGMARTEWIAEAATTSMESGDIYGLSRGGRIIKLVP